MIIPLFHDNTTVFIKITSRRLAIAEICCCWICPYALNNIENNNNTTTVLDMVTIRVHTCIVMIRLHVVIYNNNNTRLLIIMTIITIIIRECGCTFWRRRCKSRCATCGIPAPFWTPLSPQTVKLNLSESCRLWFDARRRWFDGQIEAMNWQTTVAISCTKEAIRWRNRSSALRNRRAPFHESVFGSREWPWSFHELQLITH
jgi:hypothetical protein